MGFTLTLTKENIEEAKGSSFEPLPEGTYGARIQEVKIGPSKSSGNPMYTIDYLVEHDGGKPRKVRGWHVIQGRGSFSSSNLLKALGRPYPSKDAKAGEEFEFPDGDELIGEQLNVKLKLDSYETVNPDTGEEETRFQNQISGTFPYDESKHTTSDGGEAKPVGKLL